ncbi:MAG: hypothetical protein AB8C46_25745 [Burkholderiaceae bacterium]
MHRASAVLPAPNLRMAEREPDRSLRYLSRMATITVALLLLAGCGGDGATGSGGQTGGGSPTPGTGGSNPGQVPLGFSYKTTALQGNANDFGGEANQEGLSGFRYRSGQAFGGVTESIYIKDNSTDSRFDHRLLAPSANIDDLIIQANAQGAEGYRFRGNLVFDPGGADETVALYTRNSAVVAAYAYEAREPDNTAAGRLSQLNDQGVRGYRYISDFVFGGTTTRSLYASNTSEAARYVYQLLDTPTDSAAFLQQLTEQGDSGSRFRGTIFLATDGVTRSIFVSRPEQGARYAYQFETPATTPESFVSRATELGAQRLLYQADLQFGTQVQSLYVDVTQCACQPLRLSDPFTD